MNQWAIVDLETTGGSPGTDRITEIGVVLLDGQTEVGRFQSLVDPERSIPVFVQKLTGIDDSMVRGAPVFYSLAESLFELLSHRILVAHNVAFDYKFLRHEFAQCGLVYDPQRLCTVQLGRKLYPGHSSYSLGNFCAALGFESFCHHRAMADTLACASILQKALNDHGEERVLVHVKGNVKPSILPQGWSAGDLMRLPDAPGVLWFHNAQHEVLYVTECASVRVKANHLLSMGKRSPLWGARQGIADMSFEPTGNELLAKILAWQEVARAKPPCNKALRLPAYSGPPLGDLLLVGPGRSDSEHCVIVVKQGKVLGYRFVDSEECLNADSYGDYLEPLRGPFDAAVLVRQQIQRGGKSWRCIKG